MSQEKQVAIVSTWRGIIGNLAVALITGALVSYMSIQIGAAVQDQKIVVLQKQVSSMNRKLDGLRDAWIERFGRIEYKAPFINRQE
jgi:hypothetical protein